MPPHVAGAHTALRRQAAKNVKVRQALISVIEDAGAQGGCPKAQGALLNTISSKVRQTPSPLSGRARDPQAAASWSPHPGGVRDDTLPGQAEPGCAAPTLDGPAASRLPQFPANALVHRKVLLPYIISDQIKVKHPLCV
jgi:hypothetical protein